MLLLRNLWLALLIFLLPYYGLASDCQHEPSAPAQLGINAQMKFLQASARFYSQCQLDYAKARETLDKNAQLARQSGNNIHIAMHRLHVAALEMEWDKNREGLETNLREAAKLLENSHLAFNASVLLGDYYTTQNDWNEALNAYQTAQQQLDAAKPQDPENLKAYHHDRALLLNNLNNVYRHQGNYAQAIAALHASAQTLPKHGNEYAINRYNLAQNAQAQGDYRNAGRWYDESQQALSASHGRQPMQMRITTRLAEIALDTQDSKQALTLYQQVSADYRHANAAHYGGTVVMSHDTQEDQRRFARLLLRLHTQHPQAFHAPDAEAVFWALQQLHGLQRLQTVQQAMLRITSQHIELQAVAEQFLRDQQRLTAAESVSSAQVSALQESLSRAYSQLSQHPEYRDLFQPQPLALAEVQQHLRLDEALAVWVIDAERGGQARVAYLGVVRQQSFRLYSLAIAQVFQQGRDLISDTLNSLLQVDPVKHTKQSLPAFSVAQAHRLYQILLAPALVDFKQVKHLIVVSDDELLRLPLHLLVNQAPNLADEHNYAKAHWLLRDYTFAYLPSVAAFKPLRILPQPSQTDARSPFFGIGAPISTDYPALPGMDTELQRQHQHWGNQGKVLIGKAATEEAFKAWVREGGQARILSFATHAATAITPDNPEASLILGASTTENGRLTASEIAALPLSADWVLLAACSTARPTAELQDGMSALVRAFFTAGSRSILAAHWDVDSANTQDLLTILMQKLDEYPQPAQALQHTMLELLQDETTAHPFFWGGFSLYGEAD